MPGIGLHTLCSASALWLNQNWKLTRLYPAHFTSCFFPPHPQAVHSLLSFLTSVWARTLAVARPCSRSQQSWLLWLLRHQLKWPPIRGAVPTFLALVEHQSPSLPDCFKTQEFLFDLLLFTLSLTRPALWECRDLVPRVCYFITSTSKPCLAQSRAQ